MLKVECLFKEKFVELFSDLVDNAHVNALKLITT